MFTLDKARQIFPDTLTADAVPAITARFKLLSAEDQLALIWFAYLEMGQTITIAALRSQHLEGRNGRWDDLLGLFEELLEPSTERARGELLVALLELVDRHRDDARSRRGPRRARSDERGGVAREEEELVEKGLFPSF